MSKIFAISDHHFDHEAILRFRKPFPNVHYMNDYIVECHNSVVSEEDTTYFLGDFAKYVKGETEQYFAKLNGKKYLVAGNHDYEDLNILELDWIGIADYKLVETENNIYVMSHYPMLAWDRSYKGTVHLHGHTHGTDYLEVVKRSTNLLPSKARWKNVSCESLNYYPYQLL